MAAGRYEYYDQPALEVAANNQPGLEVAPTERSHQTPEAYALQVPSEIDKTVVDSTHVEPLTRKRRWVWIGLIVSVGLVLAAVLGGVFGSKAAKHSTTSNNSTNTTNPLGASNTTVSLTQIRNGSPLSVTAYRNGAAVEIWLYYQSADSTGNLRYSLYNSSRGSFTTNGSYWEDSALLDASIASNTSIGATTIVFETNYEPQLSIYYRGTDAILLGLDWNADSPSIFPTDSLADHALSTSNNGSIASYWPLVIYQDANNVLQEVMYLLQTLAFSGSTDWSFTSLNVTALQGSKLAVVPLTTNKTTIVTAGGYGIFYQDPSGTIKASIPRLNASTNHASWPTAFPELSVPVGYGFAAFSTARPNDAWQRVNTYLLYQGSDNHIQMVWTTDGSTWQTSQPTALADADPNTDIACLTMPTSESDEDDQALLLEQASSETRCYFQRGSYVREVVLNGDDWVEIQTIPMS